MIKDLLSIVIPCKNEEDYIGRTLDEISLQFDIKGTRVIIADGGSTDSTISKINDFVNSEDNNLNIEVIKGGGVSVGRNRGAALVKTPFILFLDADITFTDLLAIRNAIDCLDRNPNLELIGTTPEYMGEFDLGANLIFFFNNITTRIMSLVDPFAVGAFMLISRKKFVEIGGFDEEVHQSEDWLLSRQIKSKNFKLIPNLITQDNRRFKKFGYLKMLKMVIKNWFNRGNKKHFHKDLKYWE
jgi:glycosyltransferase involved in cell wall biosynthesis